MRISLAEAIWILGQVSARCPGGNIDTFASEAVEIHRANKPAGRHPLNRRLALALLRPMVPVYPEICVARLRATTTGIACSGLPFRSWNATFCTTKLTLSIP